MKTIKRLVYKLIETLFLAGCSDYNSLSVRKNCRSKAQARRIFQQLKIPHAEGRVFFWPFVAHQFVRENGFPVVVKPNVSGYSRGSYFPIETTYQLWIAIIGARLWWPKSVIERYVCGHNYRAVVVGDRVVSVIERYSPFVVGDGVHTVDALIEQENAVRKEMKLLPAMSLIPRNQATIRCLKKQGAGLLTVPEKDQKLFTHRKIALGCGGVVEAVESEKISDKNKALLVSISAALKANVLGIDFIMDRGVETDHNEQDCIFLEINARPYLNMHHFPRFGNKHDLTEALAELETIKLNDTGIF